MTSRRDSTSPDLLESPSPPSSPNLPHYHEDTHPTHAPYPAPGPGTPDHTSNYHIAPTFHRHVLRHANSYSSTTTDTSSDQSELSERFDGYTITLGRSDMQQAFGLDNIAQSTEDSGGSSPSLVPHDEDSSHAPTVSVNGDSNNAVDVQLVPAGDVEEQGPGSASPEEPPAKVRKLSKSSSDGDGDACPVCLEPWGLADDHRLVSLKCGHLFGYKCVERWLRARPARDRTCPTCKARASLRDIRVIFAKRIVAVDTAELNVLQKEVGDLKADKHRIELELYQSQLRARACQEELDALRQRQRRDSLAGRGRRDSLAGRGRRDSLAGRGRRQNWRFALEKNLEIARDGGCRVLAYNSRSYELYVSQKSTSGLFPGWGVRKVACVDYRLGQFQLIHQKPIRDSAYSARTDQLMTVALDGCIKLSSNGSVSLTIQGVPPLWACAWDCAREHELYAGGVGGVVMHYDIRATGRPLSRLSSPGQSTPVLSLQSTPMGLLSCRLNACDIWRPTCQGWRQDPLPVEGPFMSMSYHSESRDVLLSCRPRAGLRGKLLVCAQRGDGIWERIQSFPNSSRASVLCRATWLNTEDQRWAVAHVESDDVLRLHSMEGPGTQSLLAREPSLDVLSTYMLGSTLLAALSETKLRVYKAVATDL